MKLDCGIARDRLVSWLDGELGLSRVDGVWIYTLEDRECRVSLAPLGQRVLGSFEIDRTELAVEGDEAAVDSLYQLFVLRFMSAGG